MASSGESAKFQQSAAHNGERGRRGGPKAAQFDWNNVRPQLAASLASAARRLGAAQLANELAEKFI